MIDALPAVAEVEGAVEHAELPRDGDALEHRGALSRVLALDERGVLDLADLEVAGEERVIDVGLRNWRFAEVLSGLEAGDLVVVARNSPDIKAGARAKERTQ